MSLRRLLLGLFLLGSGGVLLELLLLGHTEEFWQWTPVVALAAGLLAATVALFRENPATMRVLTLVAWVYVGVGFTGLARHYLGNAEFELEMRPSIAGKELFWESVRGATPALAPGVMVHLGLLGLALRFARSKEGRLENPEETGHDV